MWQINDDVLLWQHTAEPMPPAAGKESNLKGNCLFSKALLDDWQQGTICYTRMQRRCNNQR